MFEQVSILFRILLVFMIFLLIMMLLFYIGVYDSGCGICSYIYLSTL